VRSEDYDSVGLFGLASVRCHCPDRHCRSSSGRSTGGGELRGGVRRRKCLYGEPETLTFSGTLRIQEFGRQTIIHGSGSVTTTEGYVGMFNRQFVFQGDQVTTLHFFDMEIGPDGQRQLFTGVVHVTFVNGIPKAEVENLRLQCVGKA
jgi:hypothetical protein